MPTGNARPAIVFREKCQLWVISGQLSQVRFAVMVKKLVFRRTSLSLRPFNLSANRQWRELRMMSDVNCWALEPPCKENYWEELPCAP
jgi:hypothetical protein